jgi:Glutathione S-transferase, N-terminal domain
LIAFFFLSFYFTSFSRLTCLLTGLEFDDVQIQFADWAAMKPTTPHGTLPIMQIDDGPVRVQSHAMIRYLASEYSKTLYPKENLFDIEEAIGLAGKVKKNVIVWLIVFCNTAPQTTQLTHFVASF